MRKSKSCKPSQVSSNMTLRIASRLPEIEGVAFHNRRVNKRPAEELAVIDHRVFADHPGDRKAGL